MKATLVSLHLGYLFHFTFLKFSLDFPFTQHLISVWEDVFALPLNTGNREGGQKVT